MKWLGTGTTLYMMTAVYKFMTNITNVRCHCQIRSLKYKHKQNKILEHLALVNTITCQVQPWLVSSILAGVGSHVSFCVSAATPAYILLRISLPKEAPSMALQSTVTGYVGGKAYWAALPYNVSRWDTTSSVWLKGLQKKVTVWVIGILSLIVIPNKQVGEGQKKKTG